MPTLAEILVIERFKNLASQRAASTVPRARFSILAGRTGETQKLENRKVKWKSATFIPACWPSGAILAFRLNLSTVEKGSTNLLLKPYSCRFNTSAAFWISLQWRYELDLAEGRKSTKIAREVQRMEPTSSR